MQNHHFFFQAEDGIRDRSPSRGLGDVYKRQSNRFVYSVLDVSYKLTAPPLNFIRRFLPNLGSIDISPVILILGLMFFRNLVFEMFAPGLFLR